MPSTRTVSNTDLVIRLEGGQTEFAPGDTIFGCVFCRGPLMAQVSSLSIRLVGWTVSKMEVISETRLSRHRGQFNLIPRYSRQNLHQGPLHIADGDKKSWHFAITVPEYVDPADFKDRNQSESFLPLGATNNLLPSTFTLSDGGRTEGFVKYLVRASLQSRDENRKDAMLPITITNHSPLEGSTLLTRSYFYYIVSYGLIPGMEETKISLPQIIKQAMKTSSVPKFGFHLRLDMPGVIQINDPTPIPIQLRAIMKRRFTSDDIRNIPPKIKLEWISIQIIATTEVICEDGHTMEEESEMDLDIMNQIFIREQDVYIPCTEDGSFIDIGDLIDLRLDRYDNICPQYQGSAPFMPNFETYNIHRSHRLKWMVAVEVGGQVVQKTETIMLEILGPSRGLDEPMPGTRPTHRSQSCEADGQDPWPRRKV